MNYNTQTQSNNTKAIPKTFNKHTIKIRKKTTNNAMLNWTSILTIKFAPIIIVTISLILKHIIVVDNDYTTNGIEYRTHVTIRGL
jgi:hypothetical protein